VSLGTDKLNEGIGSGVGPVVKHVVNFGIGEYHPITQSPLLIAAEVAVIKYGPGGAMTTGFIANAPYCATQSIPGMFLVSICPPNGVLVTPENCANA